MAESPLFDPSELTDEAASSSKKRGAKSRPPASRNGKSAKAAPKAKAKAKSSNGGRKAPVVETRASRDSDVSDFRDADDQDDEELDTSTDDLAYGSDRADSDRPAYARSEDDRDDGYGDEDDDGGDDDESEGDDADRDDSDRDRGSDDRDRDSRDSYRADADSDGEDAYDPNDPRFEPIENKSPIRAFATTLSDRAIQRITGGNAFLRGRIYARRNAVDEFEIGEDSASARINVRNLEDPYRMKVTVEGENRIVSECSCQGWRGPTAHCKHVAALLVALRDRERPPRPKQEPARANGNGASPIHVPQTVSVGGKRRRSRRRRRGEGGANGLAAPSPIEVLSTRDFTVPVTPTSEARGSLETWLPTGVVQKPYAFEYRVTVRSASITVIPVIAGSRSAVPITEVLAGFNMVSAADRPLLRALARYINRGKPTTAEIRGEDAAEVLSMLKGRRVLLEPASMELRFSEDPLRPRIELDGSGDESVRLRVVFELASGSRRFSLSNGAWFEGTPGWHIDPTDGVARPVIDTVTPAWLQRLYRSPALVHPVRDLPYLLADFIPRVSTSLGADLPDLSHVADLVDAQPTFLMKGNGDIVNANVRLHVQYRGEDFPVPSNGFPSPLAFLPPTKPGGRPRIVRRDVGGEMAAVQQFLSLGFSPDESGEELHATGDEAIHFWTDGISTLPAEWERFVPDDLVNVKVRKSTVTPQMRVASGVDWLSLDMVFSSDGIAVDAAELRTCLESGRHIVKLADGTYAPVKGEQVGEILARWSEIEAGGGSDRIALSQVGRVQDLIRLVNDAKVSAKAKSLFDKLDELDEIEAVPKPRTIKATLRDYQKKGFSWLVFIHNLASGGILADDMGLGKTLQTIALIAWAKQNMDENLTHIVVAPTSVVPNWEREVEKFAPSLRTLIWQGQSRHDKKDEFKDVDVVITSYALLRRDEEFLSTQKLGYVILDEAQHIKNPMSATAKAAKRLQSERRLALTGTPIENRLSEFWSILDFVSPGLLGDLRTFEEKVARPIDRGDVATAERLRNTIKPFVLRRTKRDVAPELPPKIEQEMIVPLADEQTVLYQQILGEIRKSVLSEVEKQGIGKAHIQILAALTRLRQVACDPRLMKLPGEWNDDTSGKLGALREIMQEAVAGGHRVLIFSQFVEMLKIIQNALKEDGIKHEYLDGSTKDRMERVDRFNKDESYSAFLVSLKAGGTGLNLVGADTVVHFDPWWNPAVEDQATDRAHRIGQSKTVSVYRLIAKGTVEEKILQLSEKKRELMESVLATDGSPLKGLTKSDVEALFS